MAQRMQLQNSGIASGIAVCDPACSLVGAGTSCCLVYNYDVRRHLNQWLSEISSVFSEADWWVIQLTPRVFFTVFQSRKFCDRPSCPTLCNWSQWNLPQGLAYSALVVFNPVEPLDSGMTTWSDVLVSSHACMLKKFLWDCAVLVQRHFTECSQSLRNQCFLVVFFQIPGLVVTIRYAEFCKHHVSGAFSPGPISSTTSTCLRHTDVQVSHGTQFLMETPDLPFVSLNLMDGARAVEDPLWLLAAFRRCIHNNAIFRMLGEPVKLHAVGVVGKKYKGKMLVWGNFGPQPPGTRLASHPVWMARLNHPVLEAAFCRRESMSDVSRKGPMEDFW